MAAACEAAVHDHGALRAEAATAGLAHADGIEIAMIEASHRLRECL